MLNAVRSAIIATPVGNIYHMAFYAGIRIQSCTRIL